MREERVHGPAGRDTRVKGSDAESRMVGDSCILSGKDLSGIDITPNNSFKVVFGHNRAPEGGMIKQVMRRHWMNMDF